MLLEHAFQLPARRLDAGDQAAPFFLIPHFAWNGIQRALQIVVHGQHVACKTGGGIVARIGRILFRAAADILRLGLGVKDILLGFGDLLFQLGQPIMLLQFRRIFCRFLAQFLGHALQFCFLLGSVAIILFSHGVSQIF